MTVKHTPSNWSFKHEFAKHYSITHNGYWIGRMRGKENAQLVSAAPDLLEALQRLLNAENDEYLTPIGVRDLARAAIAKALGETK